jgi:hypothetical protein
MGDYGPYAAQPFRLGDIYIQDPRMGMGTAQDLSEKGTLHLHVRNISGPTGCFIPGVHPRDWLANYAECLGRFPLHVCLIHLEPESA